MRYLANVVLEIFEKYQWAGLFFLSGWLVAIAVILFFIWRLKRFEDEIEKERVYYRTELEKSHNQLLELMKDSTDIMTKLSEKFEALQQILISTITNLKK